jgi:2-methylcitrate dehydratase PrpD
MSLYIFLQLIIYITDKMTKGYTMQLLTHSWLLAEYGNNLKLKEVPTLVVEYTKLLLLDLIGAAIAGTQTEESQKILLACKDYGGNFGVSPLWGTGFKASEGLSALHNGVISHALELDDFNGADHSGAVVIPAVLAVAARYPEISSTRLLESIIVGYDVAKRILDGCGGYQGANAEGWHSTGTIGSFAAAAAVSKMLNLNTIQTANALGLAGSFTGGTWAFLADGSMSKRYHAGRAAETGILVAYMAKNGFTGPMHVLDAEWGGYFNLYAPKSTDISTVTANLGKDFRILHAGIKPYASCRGIHSSIDGILELKKTVNLNAENVDFIEVSCNERQFKQLKQATPTTRLDAQLSLPYSLAITLLEGKASLELYMEPWLHNPAVLKLAQRVKMIPIIGYMGEPTLKVVTIDGQIYKKRIELAKGDPKNPLTNDEIITKYMNLITRVYTHIKACSIKEKILTLNEGASISALIKEIS